MINFKAANTFEGGHSKDLAEGFEKKNTFIKGNNGRIYSENGILSFTSIKGSKLVYQNSQIVKYLGVHSFRDEAIVMAKVLKPTGSGEGTETQVCEQVVNSESFNLFADVTAGVPVNNPDSKITANSRVVESCYTVITPVVDPTDFQNPYSEVTEETTSIDFGEYYNGRINVANYELCNINLNTIPINNSLYYDAFFSFTINDQGVLKGERIWIGTQNWPIDGKITAEGVEENEFYKRVYYSDAVNPRRVMNRKDLSLATRKEAEFNQILNNILLQPKVVSINDGGQLKAMMVLYIYRIISQNGQVSEFSPTSEYAVVTVETDAILYRGGSPSEMTSKTVNVRCDIMDVEPTDEVECIALEFEALGVPTAIRNLGIKPAGSVVEFQHFGNEPEFIDDITLADVLEYKNTWKYCNDFTSKKNKLIAAGLRNNPVPTEIQNLEYLFPLHSWDITGNTFESLMNPKPWEYRYIDPANTDKLIYIKRKKYDQIASFGPMTLKLVNKNNGFDVTKTFFSLSLESYTDVLNEVTEWLISEFQNNQYFQVIFPNLQVSNTNDQLLFSPVDSNVETDMASYVFESNNNQFIENFKNEIVFINTQMNPGADFVDGAQSIGFHQGNGIRITYRNYKYPLLNQATEIYDGTGNLLDYHTPSNDKVCMKGEIYRLAFQAYDKASSRYFSIPLGDVMIPEIGNLIREIDDQGNSVFTFDQYVNQSVEDGVLYGHGVKMHIEVRLSCEMQELISMYQILYVERTEDNRTILCQGIAAPLNRVQTNNKDGHQMPNLIKNKWNLPYYGGPVYEDAGLKSYDANGENFNYEGDESVDRVITSRKLMYFDSPDLYYNKISSQYIESSKLNVLAKLNTDETRGVIMESGNYFGFFAPNFGAEKYPKFSRKILEDQLEGELNLDNLPRRAREDRPERGTRSYESYFINVSVFSRYTKMPKTQFTIDKAETLNRGESISGVAFNLDHDVSNNAVVMPVMPWFFSVYARKWEYTNGVRAKSTLFKYAIPSPGYQTTIIKTSEDLFTTEFIGPKIHYVDSQMRLGGGPHLVYDTYPLINIFRNNRESVYGGRTEQAYSRNTYIPLSKTIPVSKGTGIQFFDCGADTYVTLNIRTKNDAGESEIKEVEMNNGGGGRAKGDITTFIREGAWNYVAVLETTVEPKLSHEYQFYRQTNSHRFDLVKKEIINPAYLNTNNLKQYVPKPFQFKDDPNMGNVIAVSDVKLAGQSYDAWTMFKPNNFYAELEKNKGDVSNIIRHKEQIYAVQEGQTSLIYIGTDRIVTDKEGSPINLKQGSGQVVDGHQVLSEFGTSIRRAVIENEYGFCFFDEKHLEFVKMDKPLLVQSALHLDLWNELKGNRVIDSEAYYDHEHKETCVRLRTSSGASILLSYNELFKVFNGRYDYNNDMYIEFDKKLFAPVRNNSADLHRLNEGDYLSLFGQKKTMTLGVIVNSLDKVFIHKGIEIITSLSYPIKKATFRSSLGQERVILGNHNWYKIREGNHTLPSKNDTFTVFDEGNHDIRGNWVSVEIEAESLNNNKVDILAVINSLRKSHQ